MQDEYLYFGEHEQREIVRLHGRISTREYTARTLQLLADGLVKVRLESFADNSYAAKLLKVLSGELEATKILTNVISASYLRAALKKLQIQKHLKARQELSNSAPTERFMLGKRTKQLLVARLPLAPPTAI